MATTPARKKAIRDVEAAMARAKRHDRVSAQQAAPLPVDHEPLDLVVRQTAEKSTVCIIKIHNLQQEVQQLREELRATNQQLLRSISIMLNLIDDPEARQHAQAMARHAGGVGLGGEIGMHQR